MPSERSGQTNPVLRRQYRAYQCHAGITGGLQSSVDHVAQRRDRIWTRINGWKNSQITSFPRCPLIFPFLSRPTARISRSSPEPTRTRATQQYSAVPEKTRHTRRGRGSMHQQTSREEAFHQRPKHVIHRCLVTTLRVCHAVESPVTTFRSSPQ